MERRLDRKETHVLKEVIPYLSRIHTKDYFDQMNQSEHGHQTFMKIPQRCARKLLHTPGFDYVMGGIILVNLVVMIIETDQSVEDEESSRTTTHWTEVFGWVALTIFMIELLLRLIAYRYVFFHDPWSVCDFVIVLSDAVFSIVGLVAGSTFPVSMLRIFRLAKLARVSKVLRVFPELRLLMAGLMSSLSAIFWGTLLLLFSLLVWAMVAVLFIHPLNRDIEYGSSCPRCPRAYSSVMQSTLTLWQQIVAGDSWGEATIPLLEQYPSTGVFFILVYLSVGMAITNLILGVVVSVAQQAKIDLQEEDNTERALVKLEKQTHLLELCRRMDSDMSGELSHDEIFAGFEEPGEFRDIILGLDITREDFDIIWTILDSDKRGAVSYKELVSHLCTMRSSDTQFMLAYIKYYITQISSNLLQNMEHHHSESMSLASRFEQVMQMGFQTVEAKENLLLEEEMLLEEGVHNVEKKEELLLEVSEGSNCAHVATEVFHDTQQETQKSHGVRGSDSHQAAEHRSKASVGFGSNVSVSSTRLGGAMTPVDTSPGGSQRGPRKHVSTHSFHGLTLTSTNAEMQMWFKDLSHEIQKLRTELKDILTDMSCRFDSRLCSALAVDSSVIPVAKSTQSPLFLQSEALVTTEIASAASATGCLVNSQVSGSPRCSSDLSNPRTPGAGGRVRCSI